MVAGPSTGRASEVTPRRAAPEADATRELYERYARQIYSYCLHQLGNREEAEDATQSTFLNAFRGLQRGVDPEFESAWLYKIAQNVCLTRQRSSSRRRRVETPGDLEAMQDYVPAHQTDSDELIRLPEALESMPEQQRRALLLREWQGLSYKEIADALDLSQAAVETVLFRARRTLANGLVDAPPRRSSAGKRLRRSGDAGSLVAIAKSVLFMGGTKVAATVATVAATSVVAPAPSTRHVVADVVTPGHDRPAPVAHVAAKPKARHLAAAAVAPASAAVVAQQSSALAPATAPSVKRHLAKKAQLHRALGRTHETVLAFMPTHRPHPAVEPAAVAPAAAAPAAPATPVAATPVVTTPAAEPPAPATPLVAEQTKESTPPSVPAEPSNEHAAGTHSKGHDSRGKDHGKKDDHGRTSGTAAPVPSQSATTTAAKPSTVPPAPTAPAAAQPAGASSGQPAGKSDDRAAKHDGDRRGRRDDKRSMAGQSSSQTMPAATTTTTSTTETTVTPPPAPAAPATATTSPG